MNGTLFAILATSGGCRTLYNTDETTLIDLPPAFILPWERATGEERLAGDDARNRSWRRVTPTSTQVAR